MRRLLHVAVTSALVGVLFAQSVPLYRAVTPLPEVDYEPEARTLSAAEYRTDQLELISRYDNDIQENNFASVVRQSGTEFCVTGSQSRICMYHQPLVGASAAEEAIYLRAQAVFNDAARIWANNFPSAVEIRVESKWLPLGSPVLGAAGPTTYWNGNSCGTQTVSNSFYTPAVMNSLLGRDFNEGTRLPYHISMTMNSDKSNWAFNTQGTAPGSGETDLLSVALHELCHGLFFLSFVNADASTQTAKFSNGYGTSGTTNLGQTIAISHRSPDRYDRFLTDSSSVALLDSCGDERHFYDVVTSDALRFHDSSAVPPVNFRMYSPNPHEPGSSISHFVENITDLQADCLANGLNPNDKTQCSALMTPGISVGEWYHDIGENTLRVMRSILSTTPGPGAGFCKYNPYVI